MVGGRYFDKLFSEQFVQVPSTHYRNPVFSRIAIVRDKWLENDVFLIRGKFWDFVFGQRNLERKSQGKNHNRRLTPSENSLHSDLFTCMPLPTKTRPCLDLGFHCDLTKICFCRPNQSYCLRTYGADITTVGCCHIVEDT